jgi:GT2 family glycosyltransferase
VSGVGAIAVAVPSWNGRRHLETCLEALADQEDPGVPWRVWVCDNASRDGTADWLRARHPEVRLVESPVNLGFAAANNLVAREAADAGAVAFLNNDTRPERGWLRGLHQGLQAAPEDVAAVSGLIVDWEGERLDFARGVMTFDGHALQRGFRRPLAEAAAEIPAAGAELPFACGGNMLVRREAFSRAGGFDESYFAYYEDVDLGWRLWAGGERVLFAPGAVVRHRSSASSDLLGLYNRGFLFERNALLTAYKNYEAGLWEKVMPAVLLTFLARTQALLERNNPGGDLLALDPYAGLIADTAAGAGVATREPWPAKWRRYGTREFVRRALRKAGRLLAAPSGSTGGAPVLADERTQAQFRAAASLLRHLDRAAQTRAQVQFRRRRSDRDYFARFPPYLVPTYPGDEELFASPGFQSWLPPELPLVRARLVDLMEL